MDVQTDMQTLLMQRRQGHTLPQAFYTSDQVFEQDMQGIYACHWLQAGLSAEIPKVGDWVTRDLGTTSILIVRSGENRIQAHMNTCRHRGARLCGQEHGSSQRLVCPYHQWTYALDGSLSFARNMGKDFVRSQHGLVPLRCETVAGVIFVALSDTAPDFAPFRTALEPMLAPHRLDKAKVAFTSTLIEEANWKLVMENARECYHCAAKHPELMSVFRDPTREDWFSQTPAWMTAFHDTCRRAGLPSEMQQGAWYNAMRFPLAEGIESLTPDGRSACQKPLVQGCTDHIGTLRWAVEPNAFSHALKDYTFTFTVWPIHATKARVLSHWLVDQDAVEGVDYDVEHLSRLWVTTNDQDKWLAENNQRGVASLGYRPGPYAPLDEQFVLHFVDWYCARMQAYLTAR